MEQTPPADESIANTETPSSTSEVIAHVEKLAGEALGPTKDVADCGDEGVDGLKEMENDEGERAETGLTEQTGPNSPAETLLDTTNDDSLAELFGDKELVSKIDGIGQSIPDGKEGDSLRGVGKEDSTAFQLEKAVRGYDVTKLVRELTLPSLPALIPQQLADAAASYPSPGAEPRTEPQDSAMPATVAPVPNQLPSSTNKEFPGTASTKQPDKKQSEKEAAQPQMTTFEEFSKASDKASATHVNIEEKTAAKSSTSKKEKTKAPPTPQVPKPISARKESASAKTPAKGKALASTSKPSISSSSKRSLPIDLESDASSVEQSNNKKAKVETTNNARNTRSRRQSIAPTQISIDATDSESEEEEEQYLAMKSLDEDTGSKWPRFTAGDVYISLGSLHTYRLHSAILVRISKWFKDECKVVIKEQPEFARELTKKKLKFRFDYGVDGQGDSLLQRSVCRTHMISARSC